MSENRKRTATTVRVAAVATALAVGAAGLGVLVHQTNPAAPTTSAAYIDQTFGRTDAIAVHSAPPFMPGLSRNSRQVDTGLGLGNDGTVYQWGRTNLSIGGPIADPGTNRSPGAIPGMPRICQVTGMIYDANALACEDGTVWGWGGYNNRNGTDADRSGPGKNNPAQVRIGTAWNGTGALLDSILAISSTEFAGAGIRADGTIWAWGGSTGYGGNGTTVAGATQVMGLPDPSLPGNKPVYLKGAYTNFFVILENGDVYTWGGTGSLPAGTGSSNMSAVIVDALTPWMHSRVTGNEPHIVAVDGGIDMGGAILSDGTFLSWSRSNTSLRIGNRGTASARADAPGLVPGLTNLKSMQFGFTGVIFGTTHGDLWGYGASNDFGQLPQTPTLVDTEVASFTSGQGYYLWQKTDGTFWGQGYNVAGAIGTPSGVSVPATPTVYTKRLVNYDMSMLVQGGQP